MNDTGTIDLPVHGRPARSHYQVLERYGGAALVRVETRTGRKHQVRVHCAEGLGWPIVKDTLYGGGTNKISSSSSKSEKKKKKTEAAKNKDDRFHLHAASLQMPSLNNNTIIEAPLPSWWMPLMEQYRQSSGIAKSAQD